MRETKPVDWRSALPRRRSSRVLLGLGAVGLTLVLPLLWFWLLYGSALGAVGIHASAIGLGALAAGLGLAMIRTLDES